VESDMEEDSMNRLREQKKIIGEMYDNMLGWMEDLLSDKFNPETLLRHAAGMRIDLSQLSKLAGRDYGFDPYWVLGLEKTATDEEVKKRYRELLLKLHPDTAGASGTGSLLQIIIAAYRQITREREWDK